MHFALKDVASRNSSATPCSGEVRYGVTSDVSHETRTTNRHRRWGATWCYIGRFVRDILKQTCKTSPPQGVSLYLSITSLSESHNLVLRTMSWHERANLAVSSPTPLFGTGVLLLPLAGPLGSPRSLRRGLRRGLAPSRRPGRGEEQRPIVQNWDRKEGGVRNLGKLWMLKRGFSILMGQFLHRHISIPRSQEAAAHPGVQERRPDHAERLTRACVSARGKEQQVYIYIYNMCMCIYIYIYISIYIYIYIYTHIYTYIGHLGILWY